MLIKNRNRFLIFTPLSPKEFKNSITDLGVSFIKLAQVLATRADFFSKEYLDELKSLHDDIPSMSESDFDRVYSRAFGSRDIFSFFEKKSIASASIGQVHIGYLKSSNKKVAVKLRRENIKSVVKADIRIIGFFNKLFKPLFSYYTKNSIDAVIGEFSSMIMQEVSLRNELNNLKKFSSVYKESGISFPTPYEEFCSDDAIVMSFEDGFRFDDKESLKKYNIDFKNIIATLVDFYTTQMLINGYFHADPHPGNLLITEDSKIILLDFGMVKSVPSNTRVAIIELIKAANEQDYEAYIEANKKLGTIAYEAPTSELAQFTTQMFEIFGNDALSSSSMQQLAFDILKSTKNLPFKLPSDAIYILRVSAIIEGLGTTYIENFNGVKDILPILQQNMPKALSHKDSISDIIIDSIKNTPFLIEDIKTSYKKLSKGSIDIEISSYQLEYLSKEIREYLNSSMQAFGFIFLAIFIVLVDRDLSYGASIIFFIGFLRLFYK
jgi:predicted unusual protein kinase regulating ubiquinone biosynthesis (AarF/ABC1/UbiB family)